MAGKYFAAVAKVKQHPRSPQASGATQGATTMWVDAPRVVPPPWVDPANATSTSYYWNRALSAGVATRDPLRLVAGASATFEHTLEVGSNYDLSERPYDGELENYGWFGGISKALLWALKQISALLGGSLGWAIVALTLAIKLLLHPLTRRSQVSMNEFQEKMKKFQPEMEEIRKRYEKNPQKQQEELVKLYKKHNVQPFPVGGCLPMFLQMPIFLGLFYGLQYSIQLRQHSFWWIDDLSAPDRLITFSSSYFFIGNELNILPILMTIVWYLQQKMMPKPSDPQMAQQQQIMQFLPIIFGFMLYKFASGLCLYWFTSNLIGILEQKLIKAEIERRKVAAEAAEAAPVDVSSGGGKPETAAVAPSPADLAAGKGKKKKKNKRR